nr:Mrp/NBP35 family ATP-binding protein [bacterium]
MEKAETEDDLGRQLDEIELQGRMRRIGRKFLIMSGKGGVGKSTFAVNLATALVREGARVGLLDVDLHGPSIPGLLGLEGKRLRPDGCGEIRPLLTPEGLEVVSLGLILQGTGEAVIWRGPLKYKAIHQFLKDVAWGSLDYLVIDSPPGTGDEPLSIAQLAGPGTEAVLVTTPQERALDDVRRSVSFCRMLHLPAAGIVENMSGLVCPHCGVDIDLFKRGGGEKLAAETGVPFL